MSKYNKNKTKITKRLFIFILPVLIFFLFPIFVLLLSGEFVSLDERIKRQQESDTMFLVSKSYFAQDDFKARSFQRVMPDITPLGNSRMLQFRDEFFIDDVIFYNSDLGGGEVGLIRTLRGFWNYFPEGYNPKIILLGLEPSIFRKGIEDEISLEEIQNNTQKTHILTVIRGVYIDYMQGKFSVRGLLSARQKSNAIGIRALVQHAGARADGSERYGFVIENPLSNLRPDYNFELTLSHIENNTNLYKYDTEVSLFTVGELNYFLQEASIRNIHVIAFLPPYAPTVWKSIQSKGDRYSYMEKIIPAIKKDFKNNGFSLFDFTDALLFGSSDKEFLDGNHGSEKTYLRIIITMAEKDSKLARHVDLPYLKAKLEESESNLEVF